MVKKYHFQIEPSLLKTIQSASKEEALLKAATGGFDLQMIQTAIEEDARLKAATGNLDLQLVKELEKTQRRLSMAGLAQEIQNRATSLSSGILNQIELDLIQQALPANQYRQSNPTASEIYEQMNQKAIDDAKLRGERPLTEIIFTPPYDFQRAESDRRDRQRERDREHDIETARLAEIARLQVRDEHEASKQAAVGAGATVTDAPVTNTNPQNTTAQGRKPKRRDLLAPLIQDAQNDCSDPEDAAAVFTLLRTWAQAKPVRAPLVGVTEDGRIQWRDSNDKPQELSSRALGQRLKRKQEASSKPTPTHQLKRVK